MITRGLILAALLSTCALSACATAPAPVAPVTTATEVAPPAPVASAESEHEKLFALFKASDEASLKRNPIQAIFRNARLLRIGAGSDEIMKFLIARELLREVSG